MARVWCEREKVMQEDEKDYMGIAMAEDAIWWRRKKLGSHAMNAFKTGLAAVLCLWLGNLLGLTHSYWAAVSAIVVMQSDNSVTISSARDRLIGTAIGALIGWPYFMSGMGTTLCMGLP